VHLERADAVTIQPGQVGSVYGDCPAAGSVALSGGYAIGAAPPIHGLVNVLADEPTTTRGGSVPIGWHVSLLNGSWDEPATLSVYVVCGAVSGVTS